nr:hypothetical protein BaRGS_022495 [Batillaria attramentaria]
MAARRTNPRTAEGAWYSDYDGYHEDYTGIVLPHNEADDDYYFIRNKLPYGAGFNPKAMMTDRTGGVPPLYDPAQDRANGDRPAYYDQQNPRQDGYRPPVYDQQRQDSDRLQMELERQRYHNADYYTGSQNAGDWVPPEQFSPRRSTNDPNFQRAAGEGRKTPPWERDRADQVPKGYGEVKGQMGDQRFAYDRQFTPRMTRAEVSRPAGSEPRKAGGAFLFVRFPLQRGENTSCVAKACIQAKTSDLGGRFVGIARKVFDFGFPPGLDDGCAVFQFPSLTNAEVFYDSDKRIRQPDFPPPQGHAEIFVISLRKDPNTMQLFDTFLLSEVSLNAGLSEASMAEYREKFQEPFAELLQERGALPYAALCETQNDRKSLRRHFFPNKILVTLHMFKGPKHLESVMEDK